MNNIITKSETLSLVERLLGFYTTHNNQTDMDACLEFCIDFFKENKVIVKRYEYMGVKSIVISSHDTLTPEIMFICHIDMMPGSSVVPPRIDGNKLYSRGSFDMKAFVGTSMMAMKKVLDANIKTPIAIAIVTDEELGGMFGANYLVNHVGYRPKVVLDPDDGEAIDAVVTDTKHILHIKFMADGLGSHAGTPWRGVNAIELLFKTFENLKINFEYYFKTPEHDWVNSINLGQIQGGEATNEVPSNAMMMVDIRLVDISKDQLLEWIKKSIVPGVRYEIPVEAQPTRISSENHIIKKYAESIEKIIGKGPRFIKSTGASDGRYFTERDALVITHQGGGGNCQTDDEFVNIDELDILVNIYVDFIQKYSDE